MIIEKDFMGMVSSIFPENNLKIENNGSEYLFEVIVKHPTCNIHDPLSLFFTIGFKCIKQGISYGTYTNISERVPENKIPFALRAFKQQFTEQFCINPQNFIIDECKLPLPFTVILTTGE